jgi:hypothetical protein
MNIQNALQANINRRNTALNRVLAALRQKAPRLYSAYAPRILQQAGLSDTPTSWSDLAKNVIDLAASVKASKEMDSSDKRQLSLELQKIQEQNKALDKQLQLAKAAQDAELTRQQLAPESAGSAFMRTFQDYPIQWLSVAGLLSLLLITRSKGRRR